MHELSLAQGILDVIRAHTSNKVVSIRLRIGELSGVVNEALEFAFRAASTATIADGAALLIERVPLTAKCSDCSETFPIHNYCFECPRCKGRNFRVISGRELQIEEIEIED